MKREMSAGERLDRMTALTNSHWFGGDGKAKDKLTKYDIRNDIVKQVKKDFDAVLVEENKVRLNTKIIKEFLELVRDEGMEFEAIVKQVKKDFDAVLVEENKVRLNTKIIKEFLELVRDEGMEFNVGGKLLEVSCKEGNDRSLLSQTAPRIYLTLGCVGGSDEELIYFCDIVGVICIDDITLPMKAIIYNEWRIANNLQEFVEFITKGISRASADCVGLN